MEKTKEQAFHEVCSLVLAMEKNRQTLLEWLWSNENEKVYTIIEEIKLNSEQLRLAYLAYYKYP